MSSVFMQEPQRFSDVYKTSKHADKQEDKQTYNVQTGAAILGKGFSNFTFAAKVFPVLPLRRHTSSQQTNKQTSKQTSKSATGRQTVKANLIIKTIKVPYIDPQSWDQGFAGSQEYMRKSVV